MFLDLDITENEPIPDIVRIFTDGKYTHFICAKFEVTT